MNEVSQEVIPQKGMPSPSIIIEGNSIHTEACGFGTRVEVFHLDYIGDPCCEDSWRGTRTIDQGMSIPIDSWAYRVYNESWIRQEVTKLTWVDVKVTRALVSEVSTGGNGNGKGKGNGSVNKTVTSGISNYTASLGGMDLVFTEDVATVRLPIDVWGNLDCFVMGWEHESDLFTTAGNSQNSKTISYSFEIADMDQNSIHYTFSTPITVNVIY